MIEAIVAAIVGLFIGFFAILALAGVLILIVIVVGIPLAFIVRMLMPDPPD
jgi:hypothetical protein